MRLDDLATPKRKKNYPNLKVIVRLRKVLTQNEELEALFYVALLILTLITLALALVLRESPQF